MICFLGTSFAAITLREGARRRGLSITDNIALADLIFVSEDTPIDENGKRDLSPVNELIMQAWPWNVPTVITSQVTPGFTRGLGRIFIYHQAETLKIEDGLQRAMYPEMFIVGISDLHIEPLPKVYQEFLDAFDCPILKMSYEDAEFAKIAINNYLIGQVELANKLSAAAAKCGADWKNIARVLRHDSRIGKYAYLTPGDWRKSEHLVRDWVTLNELQ